MLMELLLILGERKRKIRSEEEELGGSSGKY